MIIEQIMKVILILERYHGGTQVRARYQLSTIITCNTSAAWLELWQLLAEWQLASISVSQFWSTLSSIFRVFVASNLSKVVIPSQTSGLQSFSNNCNCNDRIQNLVQLGLYLSEIVQNCSKLSEIIQNCLKVSKIVQNCSKLFKIVQNCSKLFELVQTCSNLFKLDTIGCKWI